MLALLISLLALWATALALPAEPPTTPNPSTLSLRDLQLGINCRGSFWCVGCNNMWFIQKMAHTVSDTAQYGNHQFIACSKCNIGAPNEGTCLFPQKMGDRKMSGADVKRLVDVLKNKCKACGSIPVDGNDVNKGELTVNWVHNGCGSQVCGEGFFAQQEDLAEG